MKIIECKICNKLIVGPQGVYMHIKSQHNINTKEYYDTYLKSEEDGVCKNCGKLTKFYGINSGYAPCCSNSCATIFKHLNNTHWGAQSYSKDDSRAIKAEEKRRATFNKHLEAGEINLKHSSESIAKAAKTRKERLASGEIKVWNDGLTKDQMPKNMFSKENIKKRGEGNKRSYLNGTRKTPKSSYRGHGYKKDLGHFVRSTWEANVCRILNLCNIKYEYESKNCRFKLNNSTYICDLYLPEKNMWIEIKGWLRTESYNKLKEFVKYYPNEAKNTKIINNETYILLSNLFKNKIELWEK